MIKMNKLNEFEKHLIKNAVDLYMQKINQEIKDMENRGKTPLYTTEFFPAVFKDIFKKLKIKTQ
tara:strand:+ start:1314 stop:1505 length:192 start_codon:yes stop_codon:yes gene_type:complete